MSHKHNIAGAQEDIDSLLMHLKSLQMERGIAEERGGGGEGDGEGDAGGEGDAAAVGMAKRRMDLEAKKMTLEEGVSVLKGAHKKEQNHLDDVLEEEAIHRRKAKEIQFQKKEIEEAKSTTIEDLTMGLMNYKYVGLDFIKGEVGSLIFKFVDIDPDDRNRPFRFTLNVNDDDFFELANCSPSLDELRTKALMEQLVSDPDDGFNTFIMGMRNLFRDFVGEN